MESRGPENSENVQTSQAYIFEGFILFFEDFSLTICVKIYNITKPVNTQYYENNIYYCLYRDFAKLKSCIPCAWRLRNMFRNIIPRGYSVT